MTGPTMQAYVLKKHDIKLPMELPLVVYTFWDAESKGYPPNTISVETVIDGLGGEKDVIRFHWGDGKMPDLDYNYTDDSWNMLFDSFQRYWQKQPGYKEEKEMPFLKAYEQYVPEAKKKYTELSLQMHKLYILKLRNTAELAAWMSVSLSYGNVGLARAIRRRIEKVSKMALTKAGKHFVAGFEIPKEVCGPVKALSRVATTKDTELIKDNLINFALSGKGTKLKPIMKQSEKIRALEEELAQLKSSEPTLTPDSAKKKVARRIRL